MLATENLGSITGRGISIPSAMSYLVFVTKPTGYELREQEGDPPQVGAEIEVDDRKLRVSKLAPSPLPNDPRVAAYTQER